MSSGVLLKMEVGIYAKGRGKGLEGTLLIYDHWGEYTLSKKTRRLVYAVYPRIPPQYTTANETDKMQCRLVALLTIRICIQTAGLAFGGTGLCSYRVRGVDDGSCAKHLTVESVIYAANSHTYYY